MVANDLGVSFYRFASVFLAPLAKNELDSVWTNVTALLLHMVTSV